MRGRIKKNVAETRTDARTLTATNLLQGDGKGFILASQTRMAKRFQTQPMAVAAPTGFSHNWLPGLGLLLAVFVAYQPVWLAGFIWDDDGRITANPCIVGPLGLKEIWTTSAADLCPLVYTTFWVEHALWGVAPLPYHLVNVLLHGGCAVLLWRVLLGLRVPGAWFGAALWALHPVQVETAAWVTEMKNTQSGFFYLLAVLFFIKSLRARATGDRSGDFRNYALTLLGAALALASKSSTVMLPIVLGLCAWWVEGRWQRRNLVRLAPIAVLAVFPSLLTLWTQTMLEQGPGDTQYARSFPERLATAGDAVWFYLVKLAWPHPLIFIYPRWKVDPASVVSYLPLLAVIVVLVVLWLKRGSWARPYLFAFAYFLAALLPVLGLIDGYFWRFSLVGDHFQYLASMGPLGLAGAGLARLADFPGVAKSWLPCAIAGVVLLTHSFLSWQRAWIYQSRETLWTDTVAQNPGSWMARNNLGNVYSDQGRIDEATFQFLAALELKPNYTEARNNLGNALLQAGRVDEAMAQLEQALAINPGHAEAHNNLGNALLQKGRVEEAVAHYEKALQANPNLPEAHNNLGNGLLREGRLDEAMQQYEKALELNPNYAQAHNNLGSALVRAGRVDEAIGQYGQALELDPRYAEAHENLAGALAQRGRLDEAIAQYRLGLELDPNNAGAHDHLANVLIQKGEWDDAVAEYQRAVALQPNFAEALNNMGSAFAQKGQLDQAIVQFQAALKLQPTYAEAQKNLATARAMLSQPVGGK